MKKVIEKSKNFMLKDGWALTITCMLCLCLLAMWGLWQIDQRGIALALFVALPFTQYLPATLATVVACVVGWWLPLPGPDAAVATALIAGALCISGEYIRCASGNERDACLYGIASTIFGVALFAHTHIIILAIAGTFAMRAAFELHATRSLWMKRA
jgi:hypothetical protein